MAKIKKGTKVTSLAAINEVISVNEETAIAVLEQPINETESGATVTENNPVTLEMPAEPARNPNLAPAFTTLGTRDTMGFGDQTETSWLIREILTGKYTRATLQAAFLARFVPTSEPSEIKRKKTSFSVFFSDVKRPIGTYHASRNLAILADANGVLSFDPKNYETVKAAIAGNILTELKGITVKRHPAKHAAVLAKHGLSNK